MIVAGGDTVMHPVQTRHRHKPMVLIVYPLYNVTVLSVGQVTGRMEHIVS